MEIHETHVHARIVSKWDAESINLGMYAIVPLSDLP